MIAALALCATLALSAATGWGQQSIPTAGTAVTQNFDGMGSSGTASLPTGWKFGTDWSSGTTATTQAAGTSSTGALTGTSTGGAYNFANGVTASSTDRAIGFLTTGSYTSPRSIIYAFKNDTGGTVTSITVSWNYEKYRTGTRAFDWTFFHGSTSTASTAAADGNQSYTTDAANAVVNPPTSTAKSVTITGLNIAAGATYYLRWTYTGSGGHTNAQGLGVDDFSITLTGAAAPTLTAVTLGSALAASTYGTASAGTSFTAAGTNLTGNLTVTAQSGFEVSTSSGSSYGSSVSVASGTTVWLRTAATRAAGAFNSTTVAVLSGGGAASSANVTSSASNNSVGTANLTITGLNAANKSWDGNTTVSVTGTPAYSGLVNSETFLVTGSVTWAFPDANAGSNKTLALTGSYNAPSSNYTVTQPTLTASINAVAPGAPTITGITAGNAQLSVAFTAPSSNGGATISNYEYSTNGGSNWTTPSPAVTSSPLLITGLSNGTTYDVQIRAVNSAGSGTATGTTQGTPVAPSSPTISVSPATFASALSTTYGTASSPVNFTVSGSTLSGNLMVTAPTGLEVSLTLGGSYSDSLELTATSGTVSATTVYARLKATAAAGNYNSQSILISGGSAEAQNISTSSSGNTVSQKVVTITGLGATGKVYDGTTSVTITGAATYDGLANGETHSVTDSVTWSFPDTNIGNGKVLTRSASYTAPNANYSLPAQPSLSADITAKELTGSFTANSKVFDNSTAATVASRAVSGEIGSEDVNHTGGTATFDDVNVGTGKTVTLASATLTGADAGNYTLTSVSTTRADITQGAAEITFAALPAGKKMGDAAFSAGATATLGATISYSSSNTAVATVNASTGLITLVAPGVTTITATVAGTANFTGDTRSQTLNVGAASAALTSDLMITGIIDGPRSGGTPKAIEVAVLRTVADLSAYSIVSYANGSTTASSPFALTGSATAGSFLYFATESTEFTAFFGFAPTATSNAVNVNGDEVVALLKDGAIVDVFGTIGERPSTVDTSFNYQDTWFYRNANSLPNATFTLGEWSFPEGQSDALDSLGSSGTNPAVDDPLRMPVGSFTTTLPAGAITPSGSFAAVTTTYGTASAASATTATVTGGSLTADITATAPAGFQVSSDGTTWGSTASFTQTGGFANGTLYLRLAANAAAGAYNSQVVTLSSAGAINQTVAIANSTVSAGGLASGDITLTPVGDGSYTASGPEGSTFSYSYAGRTANGVVTSYSSATAPTAAGYYTVTASATGNYTGSNTADYFVAGPVAVSDAVIRPTNNTTFLIPRATLLQNDRRIDGSGNVQTNNLSVTGAALGTGSPTVSTNEAAFITFTAGGTGVETFTYTLSDGTGTATGTVTVTPQVAQTPFELAGTPGTPVYDGVNTTVTMTFTGTADTTYYIFYKGELAHPEWKSAGGWYSDTGTFTARIQEAGNHVSDWGGSMFFQANQ